MATEVMFLTFLARSTSVVLLVNQDTSQEYRHDENVMKPVISYTLCNLADARNL
jgi:hypothetical protein